MNGIKSIRRTPACLSTAQHAVCAIQLHASARGEVPSAGRCSSRPISIHVPCRGFCFRMPMQAGLKAGAKLMLIGESVPVSCWVAGQMTQLNSTAMGVVSS